MSMTFSKAADQASRGAAGRGRGWRWPTGSAAAIVLAAAGVIAASPTAQAALTISELYRQTSADGLRQPLPLTVELSGVLGLSKVTLAVVDPAYERHGLVLGVSELDLSGFTGRDQVIFTDGPFPTDHWRLDVVQRPSLGGTASLPQNLTDALGRQDDRMLLAFAGEASLLGEKQTLVMGDHRLNTSTIPTLPDDALILDTEGGSLESALADLGTVADLSRGDVVQRWPGSTFTAVGTPDAAGRFIDAGQRFFITPTRANLPPQPIPEPATSAIALAGLALLGAGRERRGR